MYLLTTPVRRVAKTHCGKPDSPAFAVVRKWLSFILLSERKGVITYNGFSSWPLELKDARELGPDGSGKSSGLPDVRA